MMNDVERLYKMWSTDTFFREETRAELLAIQDDPKEMEDRFYKDLSFGTGGLRGILGAGTNRMNVHTVAAATAGMASYIQKEGSAAMQRGVAISYDSRKFSPEFAAVAAGVLTAAGIRVYLSDSLRPVPQLSYAVRYFHAVAGIMITASHNPPKYNGFKVYGEDGGQVTEEIAGAILSEIRGIDDLRTIAVESTAAGKEKGLLSYFGEAFDLDYTQMIAKLLVDPTDVEKMQDMHIVYTPLHGSGNKPVRQILSHVGFRNIHVVADQEQPDGSFPTVKTPNPEDPAALAKGIALALETGSDLVIGTDPDCDRMGLAVRRTPDSDEFVALTGNQTGILLLDYILSESQRSGTLREDAFVVSTVVSGRLARRICAHYRVELQTVLTGFKYIGERILIDCEQGGRPFLFGYEESYGYLAGTEVRDKDAIVASMLAAGMAAESAARGESLVERLDALYSKYGYGAEDAATFELEGKEGQETIAAVTAHLRGLSSTATGRDILFGLPIREVSDYQTGKSTIFDTAGTRSEDLSLPTSNVLIYEIGEDGEDWVCVRPSGTEPKLKLYFGVYGGVEPGEKARVDARIAQLKEQVSAGIRELIAQKESV